jgi:hypothetical protein
MYARIIITLALLSSLFSASHAEVMECYSFNPVAGKQVIMIERMLEVAKIQEKFGVNVDIYAIEIGGSGSQFDYCMRWDTPQDWGTSKDAMAASSELQAWFSEESKTPSALLLSSVEAFNLDEEVKASSFSAPSYFRAFTGIKSEIGKDMEVQARLKNMEEILEKSGLRVEVYTSDVGSPAGYSVVMFADSRIDMVNKMTAAMQSEELAEYQSTTNPWIYAESQTDAGVTGYALR